jgi:hypothetical protein
MQNDFSWGQISNKFALRSDLSIRSAGVLKAKNIMPYVHGGMFKRFGLTALKEVSFIDDIAKTKICFYEATSTCFIIFLTEKKIFFYDIKTLDIAEKPVDWKAREEAQKYSFAQIASEIDYAQGGAELILTHRLFYFPKVITYAEDTKDWYFSEFKVEMPNYWIKEIPHNNVKIRAFYRNQNEFLVGIMTEGNVSDLRKLLNNTILCERNGTGKCTMGPYKEVYNNLHTDETVHYFSAAPFKSFSEPVSEGFVNQECFILKRPMWEHSDPAVVTFHESRLVFGGYEDDKIVLYFSKVNDFHNFGEGTGNDDEAFVGGIVSGERQRIMGLRSGTSLQIYTSKGVYVVMHGGVLPLTAENLSITMQVHQGCSNLFGKLLNGETIFVGADQANVFSLQCKSVNSYTASNLSLMTSDLVREPVSLSCNSFVETGGDLAAVCDKKYDYLFIVNKVGNLAICQTLMAEDRVAWSSVETLDGKFKHVFSYQEKALFIVERDGKYYFEALDFRSPIDDVATGKTPIEVELDLLPLLSLKKVTVTASILMFRKQMISDGYIYFEGDPAFKVNGQALNEKEIFDVSSGIKLGHVIFGGQWNYGQTLKITYDGKKDLKIYGVVIPIKRG